MWAVYCGEVRGEVGTRSRMCYVGWVVWVYYMGMTYTNTRQIPADIYYTRSRCF